jgi:hypothetical protein
MRTTILLVLLTVSFVAAGPDRRALSIDDVKNFIKSKVMPFARAKSGEVLTCIKNKAPALLGGLELGKVQALFGARRMLSIASKIKATACKALKSKAVTFCQNTIVPAAINAIREKVKTMLEHYNATSAANAALECVSITAKSVCGEAADAACA